MGCLGGDSVAIRSVLRSSVPSPVLWESLGKGYVQCLRVSYFTEGQFSDPQRSLGMWGTSSSLCGSLGGNGIWGSRIKRVSLGGSRENILGAQKDEVEDIGD